MDQLTPLQKDAVLIALQFHAALIQQTIAALQPPPEPQKGA